MKQDEVKKIHFTPPRACVTKATIRLSSTLALALFMIKINLKEAFCWDPVSDPMIQALQAFQGNTKLLILTLAEIAFPIIAAVNLFLLLFTQDNRKVKERLGIMIGSVIAFVALYLINKQELASVVEGFLA